MRLVPPVQLAPAAGHIQVATGGAALTAGSVYAMESRVIEDPVSGRPLVLPVGRHHTTATATVAGDNEARP
ncbi:hypothetical protein ACFWFH_08695 [Streptomyces coelicoflavus]|uniref:hypothetical protein n=1 Tax=Streptomyces TaxID=1883 RepID=UPI001D17C26C|nr:MULTISPECIES: hypothetical protein [Streptomyces]MCX5040376.1 hypothetical protein [Streptomyces coelicoflavus]